MMRFLYGIANLMRPLEWSKSLGNMLIAVVFAAIVAGANLSVGIFVIGFASVALLWSGLYALNDFTDWKHDKLHPVKKYRPIPSGAVPPKIALLLAIMLIVFSFYLGFFFNFYPYNIFFVLCLGVMLVNQLFYTLEPFCLKKRPVLDLISGSLINPIFRFYAGWVLFIPAFNAPFLILLFILGIQFGGFGLYRMASKDHEKKLNYKSSVVTFGEKNLKKIAYLSLAAGGIAYFFLVLNNNIFFPRIEWLGWLPIRYIWLAVLSLFSLPVYKTALLAPQKINMKKMYWIVYIHYLLFIVGFIVLYLWEF